jgi:TonB-dependent SusC/RagA subfamily outer membrane receptor
MMKQIVVFLVAVMTLAACSAQRMPYNTKDPSEVNSKSKIKTSNAEVTGYTNIYDYLRGKVPGLIVEGTDVFIRGIGTFNGAKAPMFIVDGVEVQSIANVNPQDVESVEVIKDASASIYGFRAANGVVKINTLKGRKRER